jgi:hypothetical protein
MGATVELWLALSTIEERPRRDLPRGAEREITRFSAKGRRTRVG